MANGMNYSTRLILKIMIYSIGGVALFGLIYLITGQKNGGVSQGAGNIAAFCGIIAAITFISFLISLIVSSSKGN